MAVGRVWTHMCVYPATYDVLLLIPHVLFSSFLFFFHRYDAAMDGMHKVLLQKSNPSGLVYVSDWNGRSNDYKVL